MSRDHRKIASRRYRVHCPHCHARAVARTSVRVTDETTQVTFDCSDASCGHVFGAVAELRVTITHTIRPSAKPADGVTLLQVPLRKRRAEATPALPTPANDPGGSEVPPAANDDDVVTEAM